MKFVKTYRGLIDTVISEEAPISEQQFNRMVANALHGGTNVVAGSKFTSKTTLKMWIWELVDNPPSRIYYQTPTQLKTPAECYAIGQTLIARVQKINFNQDYNSPSQRRFSSLFHEVGVNFAMWLIRHNVGFSVSDMKILMEANATLETLRDIRGLRVPELNREELPDDILTYYAKAFQIEIPSYYVKRTPVRTEKGFAVLPTFAMDGNITYSGGKEYMGNTPEEAMARRAPYTLIRDAVPTQLNLHDKARLQEQVEYFLSLSENDASAFLDDNYKFVQHELVQLYQDDKQRRRFITNAGTEYFYVDDGTQVQYIPVTPESEQSVRPDYILQSQSYDELSYML